MTTVCLPRELGFRFGAGRMLMPMAAVMAILDRSEDDLLRLVEEGGLEFAFDISTGGAARREVRIYRESLLRYQAQHFRASFTSALRAAGRNEPPMPRWNADPEVYPLPVTSIRGFHGQKSSRLLYCITAILPQRRNLILTAVELARSWTCSSTHVQNLIADGALAEVSPDDRKLTHTRCVTCASAEAFLTHRRIA
jgi:hypothetical protein